MTKYLKKMRHGRLAVLLIAFVMVFAVAAVANAALNNVADPDAPDVHVVSTFVDGGKYLEVGISVDSKTTSFQSAGVVLTYDPAMLTPIKWGEIEADDGTIPTEAKVEPTVLTDATQGWANAALLPTKGADELSGKLAMAVSHNDIGYIFMSAESARTIGNYAQVLPAEAGETTALPEGLPDATDNAMEISYIAKAETVAPQATVIRFLVNSKEVAADPEAPESGTTTVPYTMAELAAGLDVAVYNQGADNAATINALLKSSPLATSMSDTGTYGGLTYIANNADYNNAGFDISANLDFVWVADGVSVNTGSGGGSTEGIVPITFFDWDGTLLGTRIVGSAGDLEGQTELVQAVLDAFELENLPAGYEKSAETGLYVHPSPDPELDLGGGLNQAGYILSEKVGYSFGCWIPYESENPTIYGNYVDPTAVVNMVATPLPKPADAMSAEVFAQQMLDGVTSFSVKAVYVDNANCKLASMQERQYTATVHDISRFTAVGFNFPVTVKVERGDVPRAASPALRLAMTVEGVTTYSLFELTGADTEYVTVSLYADLTGKRVETAVFEVIDQYQTPNWVNAGPRNPSADATLNGGTVESLPLGLSGDRTTDCFSEDSFARAGTVGMFNECFEDYAISGATVDLSRITIGSVRQGALYATAISAANRTDMFEAWKAKNTGEDGELVDPEEYQDLTWQEIYDILNPTV